MKKFSVLKFFFMAFCLINPIKMKPQSSYGIFDNACDIGKVINKGSCIYESSTEKYYLKGSGKNMWFGEDEFYFTWKKVIGDINLYTWIDSISQSSEPHRKAGVIIRESLEPDCRYVSIAYHAGDGLISMQYRLEKDSMTLQFQSPSKFLPVFQIEKTGNIITAKASEKRSTLEKIGEIELSFGKPEYYIGLFVCAHNPDQFVEARFSNTRLTIPAKADFIPYKDYIGSRLEILDIETGIRKIIYQTNENIEAPNWSKDGKYLIVNSKGLLYRIPAEGGELQKISTGLAIANNNDHGISPDGKTLVISNHVTDRPDGENSLIFILPIEGGIPKQVTANSPSYWHGWSPDGKYLIYTAKRKNQWSIFRIPVEGGEEVQLTNNAYLNDGSEYSTDGQDIWFNSNRTGTMEIWRMKQDGSGQTQVTNDEYQNWFAHQSPNGKWVIFLSYPAGVNSWDHPYYKQVMLRLMSTDSLKPAVIAHLYGGQGTINVPSWSPDSKKIAFVSQTDWLK